jgi:hypothetical protein
MEFIVRGFVTGLAGDIARLRGLVPAGNAAAAVDASILRADESRAALAPPVGATLNASAGPRES